MRTSSLRSVTLFLTLSFGSGCTQNVEAPDNSKELGAPLTVPVPTLNQFVVLSRVGATFGQRCIVTGGDIGVAASALSGGNDARLAVGEVLLAPSVVLGARTVTGEIGADQISAPPSAITGPRSAFVAPPLAPAPGAINAGNTAINVNSGQTSTLAAGRFGAVTVSGTLNLSGGLYEVRSVRVNPDGRIIARADTTLRVASTLSLADRAQLNVAAPLTPQSLRLVVAGSDGGDNSVTLGADARVSGLLVALRTVRGADRAIMAGSVAARQLILGNDARLSHSGGFECASDAGCDDANDCTQEACVDARCVRSNAANGSACDDGLACTQGDACQAGLCVATPVVCGALDLCHDAGSCDEGTGECTNPPKNVACAALDQCHEVGSCDPQTGLCTNPVKPDGSTCDDADACTQTDSCQAGSCAGADPVTCAALDQCHVAGSCDPATGVCSDPPATDGLACDDQDECTVGDACQSGSCQAGDDYPITEFATGLTTPRSLASGPLDSLWLVSSETSPGARDGSLARITTSGGVTRTFLARELGALLHGPDGMLWVSEKLVGGLSALGRYDTASRAFAADFTGIAAYDLAESNDDATPIVWFTGGSAIGRITPSGGLLTPVPTFYVTRAITAAAPAPRTLLWFTEANAGGFAMVGRLDFPNLQQFAITTPGELVDIAEGPDGGIWFTDPAQNEVGRMPAAGGAAVKYALPSPGSGPHSLVVGSDGNLWVSLKGLGKLARITPAGEVLELCIPTAGSAPTQLATGPDGNVWFIESATGKVGRVSLGE